VSSGCWGASTHRNLLPSLQPAPALLPGACHRDALPLVCCLASGFTTWAPAPWSGPKGGYVAPAHVPVACPLMIVESFNSQSLLWQDCGKHVKGMRLAAGRLLRVQEGGGWYICFHHSAHVALTIWAPWVRIMLSIVWSSSVTWLAEPSWSQCRPLPRFELAHSSLAGLVPAQVLCASSNPGSGRHQHNVGSAFQPGH
jgi:hypothetical protein